MTNLPMVLSTLNAEITVLTEKLSPIGFDHVSTAMDSLLSAGLSLPVNIKPEDAPKVYAYALAHVSTYGLRKAISKLIRGEYENINRAFIPTPPEIAAMARAETRTIVEDLARLKVKREALEFKPPAKNPQTAARIKEMVTKHKEQHAARKAIATIPQEPITDEKAEYYRSILALRDTGDVSAEQMAYRRVIAQEVRDSQPADDAQEPQA